MLRTFGLIILSLLLCVTAEARKKKPKTGKIEDSVFVDAKYGFQVPILPNWKPRTPTDKGETRLTLTQIEYEEFETKGSKADKFLVPKMAVFITESDREPDEYLLHLVKYIRYRWVGDMIDEHFDGPKETYLHGLLPQGQVKRTSTEPYWWYWQGKSYYSLYHFYDPIEYGGVILVQEKDGLLLVVACFTEVEAFPDVHEEVRKMISGIKW